MIKVFPYESCTKSCTIHPTPDTIVCRGADVARAAYNR